MSNEEIDESPYCEVCGTCGCIGCCGIRNFISEHIEGKTNCKNEGWIIQELINLCEYKDEVFKENERLNNIINELTDLILIKKARAENEKDYSKYYIEGFSKALSITHSTPDGIMLETIKSTTIKLCSEFLNKIKELKEKSD